MGSRPPRAWAPLLLAAALLVCLIPPAQGAEPYLELTGTLASPVPIDRLALRTDEGSTSPTPPCSAEYFTGDPAAKRFRFSEGSDDNGCVGVQYTLPVPEGVRRLTVAFFADRLLSDTTGGINLGPAALEQEVRLRVDDRVVASSPYFGSQQGAQKLRPFNVGFDVPGKAAAVEVEWWFANRADPAATGDPSAGRLQAWSANVSDPVVLLEGIQLPAPALHEHKSELQGEAFLRGHRADLAVPEEYQAAAAAGYFALHLRMPSSVLVDRLLSPDGTDLADDDYATSIIGGSRLITIPAPTLARLGPGPFAIRFQATEPVVVEPTMAALTVVAFLMPPVAIVLAVRQLRRRSLDTYLEAAGALEGELAPR